MRAFKESPLTGPSILCQVFGGVKCELRNVIFSSAMALFLQKSVSPFYGAMRAGVVSVFLASISI